MHILLALMVIDYFTGTVVAGVFKTSSKSKGGTLNSKAGFKGLCKKCTMLLCLCVAYKIDAVFNINYVEKMFIAGFAVNELISVVENLGFMGAPLPKIIESAFETFGKHKRRNTLMKFLMDAPPELTGDAQIDIKNLYEHIIKLQEELEIFIERMSRNNG